MILWGKKYFTMEKTILLYLKLLNFDLLWKHSGTLKKLLYLKLWYMFYFKLNYQSLNPITFVKIRISNFLSNEFLVKLKNFFIKNETGDFVPSYTGLLSSFQHAFDFEHLFIKISKCFRIYSITY